MRGLMIREDVSPRERRRLAKIEDNPRVARRLLAIAAALDGMSREAAARIAGMDRQTLRDWVIRYKPWRPGRAVGPLGRWPPLPPDGGPAGGAEGDRAAGSGPGDRWGLDLAAGRPLPDRAEALTALRALPAARGDLQRDRHGPADARARPVLADAAAAARRDGPSRPGGIQKKGFAAALAQITADHPEAERIEVWFQDEARVGQKRRMVRRWVQRGMRPRMVKDQRYRSACIFGAVCPARDTGAALVLTHVPVAAIYLLLEEVASQLPPGTHAAMLIDNAGRHTANDLRVPPNITLVHLPPYSPELNAIEKLWQYLRDRYLSGRPFPGTRTIVNACCAAWNSLIAEAGRIRSLADFEWARPVNT